MDEIKQFTTIIERLDHSKSSSEKFRDFCTLAYCALAKTTQPDGDADTTHALQQLDLFQGALADNQQNHDQSKPPTPLKNVA